MTWKWVQNYGSLVVVAGLTLAYANGASAAAERWPVNVVASYEIAFAGVKVGWFKFNSRIADRTYSLEGRGKVSALFGAFTWQGKTESSGHVARDRPDPAHYSFDYKANSKNGGVKMAFNRRAVTQLEVRPDKRRSRKTVPLLPEHLRDVFDPLSAIMALTRTDAGHPCQKRLPIFDGRQRFDLVFEPAGRERKGRDGAPPGYICRVRYVPVAGYKPNRVTHFMSQTNDIRVILRRVPDAGVSVPFEVRLPTLVGDAVMRSRKTVILTADKRRIAIAH